MDHSPAQGVPEGGLSWTRVKSQTAVHTHTPSNLFKVGVQMFHKLDYSFENADSGVYTKGGHTSVVDCRWANSGKVAPFHIDFPHLLCDYVAYC